MWSTVHLSHTEREWWLGQPMVPQGLEICETQLGTNVKWKNIIITIFVLLCFSWCFSCHITCLNQAFDRSKPAIFQLMESLLVLYPETQIYSPSEADGWTTCTVVWLRSPHGSVWAGTRSVRQHTVSRHSQQISLWFVKSQDTIDSM